MNKRGLTVVARIKSRTGKEEELKSELLALIGPTRSEPGCINYDLHQAVGDPTFFMFHETWKSKEHLEKHLGSTHFKTFTAKAEGLLDGPSDVTLWEMIG